MVNKVSSSGIVACEEAFERLKTGNARFAAHVDLDSTKITAGIVSVEAGFDRGYLKKARRTHQELIAKIEAHRSRNDSCNESQLLRLRRALSKSERATDELERAQEKLYQVLAQNLQLVERVRTLESELSSLRQAQLAKA